MNHYGTLVGAAEYHAAFGNTAWALVAPDPLGHTDEERTAALARGSRALDGRYARQFSGHKTDVMQENAWPRTDAYDFCASSPLPAGSIPVAILYATYELALLALVSPDVLTPVVTPGRLTQSEAVSGAVSRSFFGPKDLAFMVGDSSPLNALRPNLLVVEDLIACFLKKPEFWSARVV